MNAPRREEPAPRLLEPSSALAAIERERFHSYSSLVRNLHWLAAALVVLYSLLYPAADRLALWWLAGLMMVYTLALHSRLFARLSVEKRMWAETASTSPGSPSSSCGPAPRSAPSSSSTTSSSMPARRRPRAARPTARPPSPRSWSLGVTCRSPPAAGRRRERSGWWSAGRGSSGRSPASGWSPTSPPRSGTLGANLHRSLFVAAHTDALTGLPNLRYFTIAADLRSKLGPYTIVMVDIDHLKTVNDTFGHAEGSELIRTVADAIRSAARSGDDLCSRIGGDEFIVRLAGATGDGAVAYCRRVRTHLAEHPLPSTASPCRSRSRWASPPTPSTAGPSPRSPTAPIRRSTAASGRGVRATTCGPRRSASGITPRQGAARRARLHQCYSRSLESYSRAARRQGT